VTDRADNTDIEVVQKEVAGATARRAVGVLFLQKTTKETRFRPELVAEDIRFLSFCQNAIRGIRAIRGRKSFCIFRVTSRPILRITSVNGQN
jgi:hypothetical protein